jgi:hypothetical protein
MASDGQILSECNRLLTTPTLPFLTKWDNHAVKCAIASPTFFLLWMFVGSAHSQVVVIAPDGRIVPPPNDPEYCAAVEQLRPNLVLKADTNVQGRVTDQTTAPLKDSRIELRRFISAAKQVVVKQSSTDADGKFDLGMVRKGQYRLLLSAHRGFKQPEKLECKSHDCALETMLILNPSDQLAASCPIR